MTDPGDHHGAIGVITMGGIRSPAAGLRLSRPVDDRIQARIGPRRADEPATRKVELPPPRFERGTPGLGILCSIHLSYGGRRGTVQQPRGFAKAAATPMSGTAPRATSARRSLSNGCVGLHA